MKFKKQVMMEVAVGLFIVAMIFVLLAMTTVLSEEMLFKKYETAEVVFDSLTGLLVGNEVNVRGVTVGKVKQIFLREDGAHVLARIEVPIQLREDYRIEVRAGSLLGGSILFIDEGTPEAAPVSMEGLLRGSPSPALMDTATETIQDIQTALNDGILADLKASMAQIRKITADLGEGEGTLNRLLEDDELYAEIQLIAENIRIISDSIAKGEGTIGKLVKDDRVYQDLQEVVANLQTITDGLSKGEGTMGRLLSKDDQMYQDLAATIASIRGVSEAMARGEGTVGKLFADETLYLEIEALLREGRAAVDDMRETSPITTFTSIFFGAF